MNDSTPAYPPPPWRLCGISLQMFRLVDLRIARRLVPPPLRIVPVAPRRTLGILYCARYEAPSSLPYHELALAPALVRAKGRFGFWISNIYVDHDGSRAGGRCIWGLPKELATFQWSPDEQEVAIAQGSLQLCRIHAGASVAPASIPAPLFMPVLSQGQRGLQYFAGVGHCRLSRTIAGVTIDTASPLAGLGFELATRALIAARLSLRIPAPLQLV
jgi:acetoacetate decarboxylase